MRIESKIYERYEQICGKMQKAFYEPKDCGLNLTYCVVFLTMRRCFLSQKSHIYHLWWLQKSIIGH